MIKYIHRGDIFESSCDAYVNPVNLIGVMTSGVALNFKEEFPENYKEYNELSIKGETAIGLFHVHEVTKEENEDYEGLVIINFPVKSSSKWPSKLEYVEAGLKELVDTMDEWELDSIAIPALGCDDGKLNWAPVKELMEKYLNTEDLKDVTIEIYEPQIKVHK
jgi:O-acetyl-ADP-ribose deacetylase (regulator of RNase III)